MRFKKFIYSGERGSVSRCGTYRNSLLQRLIIVSGPDHGGDCKEWCDSGTTVRIPIVWPTLGHRVLSHLEAFIPSHQRGVKVVVQDSLFLRQPKEKEEEKRSESVLQQMGLFISTCIKKQALSHGRLSVCQRKKLAAILYRRSVGVHE